ncbi:sialoadhesin-like [Betta splendens]|uniref:Sialoadhesin-like n=1 Tax=Betta splendens TaxID=158456 RepID=A0A9W2Y4V7_BETSP|nr:sialoadhesin-like [Betta splendens]
METEMGFTVAAVALLIALNPGALCESWAVALPRSLVGVGGSCLVVPCSFSVPRDQEAKILGCSDGGVWRKGDLTGPVVLNALHPFTNVIQVLGDLTQKNCTTMFHSFPKNYSDTYFLRLNCPDVKYTFATGVAIAALGAFYWVRAPSDCVLPLQPRLPPRLTPAGVLTAGAPVRLRCWAPAPCPLRPPPSAGCPPTAPGGRTLTCFRCLIERWLPPTLRWLPPTLRWLPPTLRWPPPHGSRQEDTHVLQSADGHVTMTSTLTFVASADHHQQNLSCSVSYPLTKGGSTEASVQTQRLNVLYAPRFTVATLSTSGPVPEGRIVTFTCSSDANPAVSRYIWYRDDGGNMLAMGEGRNCGSTSEPEGPRALSL